MWLHVCVCVFCFSHWNFPVTHMTPGGRGGRLGATGWEGRGGAAWLPGWEAGGGGTLPFLNPGPLEQQIHTWWLYHIMLDHRRTVGCSCTMSPPHPKIPTHFYLRSYICYHWLSFWMSTSLPPQSSTAVTTHLLHRSSTPLTSSLLQYISLPQQHNSSRLHHQGESGLHIGFLSHLLSYCNKNHADNDL